MGNAERAEGDTGRLVLRVSAILRGQAEDKLNTQAILGWDCPVDSMEVPFTTGQVHRGTPWDLERNSCSC